MEAVPDSAGRVTLSSGDLEDLLVSLSAVGITGTLGPFDPDAVIDPSGAVVGATANFTLQVATQFRQNGNTQSTSFLLPASPFPTNTDLPPGTVSSPLTNTPPGTIAARLPLAFPVTFPPGSVSLGSLPIPLFAATMSAQSVLTSPAQLLNGRGSVWQPGLADLRISFCHDEQWSPGNRAATLTGFEQQSDCGRVGWSDGINGAPVLRIPWRIRMGGLALLFRGSCGGMPVTVEPGGTLSPFQQACNTLHQFVPRQCVDGLAVEVFGNFSGPVTNTQPAPLELVLETDLQPVPCAIPGDGSGLPACLSFPDAISTPDRPIRPPGVAFVPSYRAARLRNVAISRGLSFQLQPRSGGLCNIPAQVSQAVGGIILPFMEQFILDQVVRSNSALVPPQIQTIFNAAFPAPGTAAATVRAPTCVANLLSSAPADLQCNQNWLIYGITRGVYRYLTRPFNGPGGDDPRGPRLRWDSWRLGRTGSDFPPDLGANLSPRNTLVVTTRPATLARQAACSQNPALVNPAFSPGVDLDGDGVPDACDNCPTIPNALQRNCNLETELNLGQQTPGVGILGDACDPNPCNPIDSVGRLDVRRSEGLPQAPPAPVGIRSVQFLGQAAPLPTPPVHGANRINPYQLRRCGCEDVSGLPLGVIDCPTARSCRRDGVIGPIGSNFSWQMADVLWEGQACPRDPAGRCQIWPRQPHVPEVTASTLLLGRQGRESRNDLLTSWQWDFAGELSRGGLLVDRSNGSSLVSMGVYLWTRASNRVTPSPVPTPSIRLTDHFRSRPDTLYGFGAAILPSLSRCALLPHLCGPIRFFPRQSFFDPPRMSNPWWQQSGANAFGLVAVDQQFPAEAASVPSAESQLSPAFTSVVAGVYDAVAGTWTAFGGSEGALPPYTGTAFAHYMDDQGVPHFLGVGGVANGGQSSWLFDGEVRFTATGTRTRWTRTTLGTGSVSQQETSPGPRSYASFTANAAGNKLYLFGGETPIGEVGDLWEYNPFERTWTALQSAVPLTPRSRAGIVADSQHLVIFGGRGEQGALLGEMTVLDLETGIGQTLVAPALALANARATLHGGRLYVYGGQTANGVSNELLVYSIVDGTLISRENTSIASASGAGLVHDAAGTLYIIPGSVAGSTQLGGALSGRPGQLSFVAQRTGSIATPQCNGMHSPLLGLPCQRTNMWTSQPGTMACGAVGLQCAGSFDAVPGLTSLAPVSAFAVDSFRLVVAHENQVRWLTAAEPLTQVASALLSGNVVSVALANEFIVAATNNMLSLLSAGESSGTLSTVHSLESCGRIFSVTYTRGELLVNSSTGIERFAIVEGRLVRTHLHLLRQAIQNDRFQGLLDSFDASAVQVCRLVNGLLGSPSSRAEERRIDRTDDGVIWISQGNSVLALQVESERFMRVLGHTHVGSQVTGIRAVGNRLAVLAEQGRARTIAETLQWVPTTVRGGSIQALGPHQLTTWITEHPEQVNRRLYRIVANTLEVADAAP